MKAFSAIRNPSNMEKLVNGLQNQFPAMRMITSAEEVNQYKKNTCSYEREIPLVLVPSKKEEVIAAVRLAYTHNVPLYPISRGRNWGFGSKLPAASGSAILDLQQLNKIIEINEAFGYAVIEPGVTQGELSDRLDQLKSSYFLDVTGSSRDSSVLGNALERGIAYNTLRVETVHSLEVLTGTGEVIKTGFYQEQAAPVSQLYKHALGPDLQGLFFQSNFGIVLSATIELIPLPEYRSSTLFNFSDHQLPKFMAAIQDLKKSGIITGIVHTANRERLWSTIGPLLINEYKRQGYSLNRHEAEKLLLKMNPQPWTSVIGVKGNRSLAKAAEREIRKKLRSIGSVQFMTPQKVHWAKRLLKALRKSDFVHFIDATEPLRGLTIGRPTDQTLYSLFWNSPADQFPSESDVKEPDQTTTGFLYAVPFAPFDGQAARELVEVANKVSSHFGFAPAITLNAVSHQCLEAVVSVSFDKTDPFLVRRAHNWIRQIDEQYRQKGFLPYRLNTEQMRHALRPHSATTTVLKELKQIFDPKGIISPGRYVP